MLPLDCFFAPKCKKITSCWSKGSFILFDLPKRMILKEACILTLVHLKERINLISLCSFCALIYYKHQSDRSEHWGTKSVKFMAESIGGAYWDRNDWSSRTDKITYHAPSKYSEFHPEQHFGHRNWNKVWTKCLKHGFNNRVVKIKHPISN